MLERQARVALAEYVVLCRLGPAVLRQRVGCRKRAIKRAGRDAELRERLADLAHGRCLEAGAVGRAQCDGIAGVPQHADLVGRVLVALVDVAAVQLVGHGRDVVVSHGGRHLERVRDRDGGRGAGVGQGSGRVGRCRSGHAVGTGRATAMLLSYSVLRKSAPPASITSPPLISNRGLETWASSAVIVFFVTSQSPW